MPAHWQGEMKRCHMTWSSKLLKAAAAGPLRLALRSAVQAIMQSGNTVWKKANPIAPVQRGTDRAERRGDVGGVIRRGGCNGACSCRLPCRTERPLLGLHKGSLETRACGGRCSGAMAKALHLQIQRGVDQAAV